MYRQEFRLTIIHLLATALWVASLTIWALAWATDTAYLAGLAIILSAAAGTACVRAFLTTQQEEIKTALVVTGRNGRVKPLEPLP